MHIAQVGEPVLRTPAKNLSVDEILDDTCQSFIDNLLQTMLDANGVGIAAPQVFDPRAIMIVASRPNKRYPDAPHMQPLVLINPNITESSQQTEKQWEGCLSVPGLRGCIARPKWVEVSYQDRIGKPQKQRFDGFVGRIFQHELDHLLGQTWLDRVTDSEDIMAESVWLKRFAV